MNTSGGDAPRRNRWASFCAVALIALLAIYVLGSGPLVCLSEKAGMVFLQPVVSKCYAPLWRVADNTAIADPVIAYLKLCKVPESFCYKRARTLLTKAQTAKRNGNYEEFRRKSELACKWYPDYLFFDPPPGVGFADLKRLGGGGAL